MEAVGRTGALAPGGIPETGEDTSTLDPRFGLALKAVHFLHDRFSLGLIAELRSFDPSSARPLSATLEPDDFTTWHFLLSSRYWLDPIGASRRWRPFLGIDLGYIPEVELDDVRVVYPTASGLAPERVDVAGDAYWTVAPVIGLSYLLRPNLSVELGAFYEWSLDPSEGELRLANLGGAAADVEVWPEGLILFLGCTWYW